MQLVNTMVMRNDTLYVNDEKRAQLEVFDTDGNYIKTCPLDNMLFTLEPAGPARYIGTFPGGYEKDGDQFLVYNLHLRDARFKRLNILTETAFKFNSDGVYWFDYLPAFLGGEKNIYVAKLSTDDYCIDVYDFEGKKNYRITKSYRRILMDKEVHNALEEKWGCKHSKYKKVIDQLGMYEDKNGYLLVNIPLERNETNKYDFVVDAFKDGVFVNRFSMDIGKGFDTYNHLHKKYFYGDRIYSLNCDDNTITVYEY